MQGGNPRAVLELSPLLRSTSSRWPVRLLLPPASPPLNHQPLASFSDPWVGFGSHRTVTAPINLGVEMGGTNLPHTPYCSLDPHCKTGLPSLILEWETLLQILPCPCLGDVPGSILISNWPPHCRDTGCPQVHCHSEAKCTCRLHGLPGEPGCPQEPSPILGQSASADAMASHVSLATHGTGGHSGLWPPPRRTLRRSPGRGLVAGAPSRRQESGGGRAVSQFSPLPGEAGFQCSSGQARGHEEGAF